MRTIPPKEPRKQAPIDTGQHEQLSFPLAIEDAPRKVRAYGLQEAHALPLVSRGRASGWRTTRRPTRIAWRYWPEIELRTPGSFPALILDCDSELRGCKRSSRRRMPNWTCRYTPARCATS